MSATFPHAVVEIVHGTDKVTGAVDNANTLVRAISAGRAFREYDYLLGQPVLNSVGDFRGMVVSKTWRSVFQFTSDYKDTVGNIAVLAGLAANIVEARDRVNKILSSKDPGNLKAAQLSTLVTSVITRTLTGVVPAGTHILATSLEGYCMLGEFVNGGNFQAPQHCVDKLKSIDAYVTSTYNTVTDSGNMYYFIQTTVNPWISERLGF